MMARRRAPKQIDIEPNPLPVPHSSSGLRKIPKELAAKQRDFVAQALMAFVDDRSMFAQAKALNLYLTHGRIQKLKKEVRAAWKQQSEETLKSIKDSTVQRITRRMRQLDNILVNEPGNTKVHGALVKWEEQLAQIQGTYAPIKVDVDVRVSESIVGVIANLSPEQVQEMYERRQRLEHEAQAARHLLTHDAAE